VRDALSGAAEDVIISANAPDATDWLPGVPIVADVIPGAGGLAGIHAAMAHAPDADVLAVAWDMPFVSAPLLMLLRKKFLATGAEVCLPESTSPHGVEPFCACYRAGVRDRLDAFLRGGGGAGHEFLRQCRVSRVTLAELRTVGDPGTLFLSINDDRDLDRARALDR
jgi:molybdenum cofactor guanylyltransferase